VQQQWEAAIGETSSSYKNAHPLGHAFSVKYGLGNGARSNKGGMTTDHTEPTDALALAEYNQHAADLLAANKNGTRSGFMSWMFGGTNSGTPSVSYASCLAGGIRAGGAMLQMADPEQAYAPKVLNDAHLSRKILHLPPFAAAILDAKYPNPIAAGKPFPFQDSIPIAERKQELANLLADDGEAMLGGLSAYRLGGLAVRQLMEACCDGWSKCYAPTAMWRAPYMIRENTPIPEGGWGPKGYIVSETGNNQAQASTHNGDL